MPGELTAAGSDHGSSGPSAPREIVGAELRRATPAEAARTIVDPGGQAMLATITDRPPGFPFGSLVSYALDDDGHPLLVISTMAEHTRNASADERASLLVAERPEAAEGHGSRHGGHDADGGDDPHDPLDAGRVTLLGRLRPVPPQGQAAATARVVAAVPSVGGYAHFRDFSCWRLQVEAVRWVAGFGSMGWVDTADYLAAAPDPVLARRRGILAHMNADHADACIAIVAHALGRHDLEAARMVAVDRFGCDYLVTVAGGGGEVACGCRSRRRSAASTTPAGPWWPRRTRPATRRRRRRQARPRDGLTGRSGLDKMVMLRQPHRRHRAGRHPTLRASGAAAGTTRGAL